MVQIKHYNATELYTLLYGVFDMNKYLVALSVGGLIEMSEITYQDFDIIKADSQDEAREKYNKIHNCSYFYGTCLAEKVDGKVNVLNNKVSYEQVDRLNAL